MKRKTPQELSLTQAQYDALLKVREMLDTNCIAHVPVASRSDNHSDFIEGGVTPEEAAAMPRLFNMNSSGAVHQCGTVACIGGWMDVVLGVRAMHENYEGDNNESMLAVSLNHPLRKLFYPADIDDKWSSITNEMAVQAIDNTLATGYPDWREITKAGA